MFISVRAIKIYRLRKKMVRLKDWKIQEKTEGKCYTLLGIILRFDII